MAPLTLSVTYNDFISRSQHGLQYVWDQRTSWWSRGWWYAFVCMILLFLHPAALPPGKRPGTHSIGGWIGPRAGVDGCGKLCPQRDWVSDLSARSDHAIPAVYTYLCMCSYYCNLGSFFSSLYTYLWLHEYFSTYTYSITSNTFL
jgi:hypothetical protein